jgi:hypothetical protein
MSLSDKLKKTSTIVSYEKYVKAAVNETYDFRGAQWVIADKREVAVNGNRIMRMLVLTR